MFISYRRDDSAPLARALAETLRYRFGADKVFLDEDSIQHGENWPTRLENAVAQATVILALIGTKWLIASDNYGRRRLDMENDWVRKELEFSNQNKVPILPILIGKNTEEPPQDGLPAALSWLSFTQSMQISNSDWHTGLHLLVERLKRDYGFADLQRGPVLPEPGTTKRDEAALSEEVLTEALEKLDGWEPIETLYPPRREIRKVYHFKSFAKAIDFMQRAVPKIEQKPVHHPRWENQYKAVTVYFSTWDAGSKITQFDVDAAKMMDEIYREA